MASSLKVTEVYSGPGPIPTVPDPGPNSFYSVQRWDNTFQGAANQIPTLVALLAPYIGQKISFFTGLSLALQLVALFAPQPNQP